MRRETAIGSLILTVIVVVFLGLSNWGSASSEPEPAWRPGETLEEAAERLIVETLGQDVIDQLRADEKETDYSDWKVDQN